jgi:hypothetical protein
MNAKASLAKVAFRRADFAINSEKTEGRLGGWSYVGPWVA